MVRYAVYFAPAPDSALWRFGSAAIGYDAATATEVPHLALDQWTAADLAPATTEPRRYGFHATLKAPFRLAPGGTADTLLAAAEIFARGRKSFDLAPLQVAEIGNFVALVETERSAALEALAGDAVTAFDAFRAPLTEAELARRKPERLDERARLALDRWGYPHVFEDFRFHMTLSGPLEAPARTSLAESYRAAFAPIAAPVPVDAITIFVQPDPASRFRILGRYRFGG